MKENEKITRFNQEVSELKLNEQLCDCKGSGGLRMDGTCARCNKPLELKK